MWTDIVQTVFVAIGAIGTIGIAWVVHRHEVRARERDRREAEVAQAQLVYIKHARRLLSEPTQVLRAKVVNDSDKKIDTIRLTLTARDDPANRTTFPIQMMPGRTEKDVRWKLPEPLRGTGRTANLTTVELQFTDAAGRVWRRVDRGQPELVSTPDDAQSRGVPWRTLLRRPRRQANRDAPSTPAR